ncbi:MAG TPA: hypothetical protein VFZ08_11230 [Terriglobia bacterium]|nr:hypothetical protein [Terriglobia bacterium]
MTAVDKSPHPAFGHPLPEGEGMQKPLNFRSFPEPAAKPKSGVVAATLRRHCVRFELEDGGIKPPLRVLQWVLKVMHEEIKNPHIAIQN